MRALKRVSAATRTGHLLSGIGAICADVLLLVAAFTALPWLIAATAALSVTVRVLTWRRSAAIAEAFSRFLIANLYRSIFRDAAVAVALVRVGVDGRVLASAAGAILVVWLAALCTDVAAAGLRRLGPAVLTRNITIDGAHRATAPASYWPAPRVLDLNVVVLCGVAVSLLTGIASVLYAASIVTAAAGILAACAVVVALLRVGGGQRDHPGVAANAVAEALNRLGPQVVLYSPGEARDSYQVAMWLGTLAQLKEPAVVVVRDRGMFASIGDTTLPVLCVPNTLDLVNLDLPTVRAVLYPGNFGDNVHMLRRPGLRHVFVGHGDSDKAASANPFTKVYDEVWVAAAAGRDRYAVADVGVDDKDIVEVGRPQLDAVARRSTSTVGPDAPFTVLYAPTWEGWEASDQRTSSVAGMGERLVRMLTGTPGVRVIYRPHPLNGSRLPAARQADASIRAILRHAGAHPVRRAEDLIKTHHAVVTASVASIYECFAVTDLLIGDVSSVLVDFLKTQTPYAVTNVYDVPAELLRSEVPSVRAGYLLSADCAGLAAIIAGLRAGDDPMRDQRRRLREYLLGPDDLSAFARFQAEITRLCSLDTSSAMPRQRAPRYDNFMTSAFREQEATVSDGWSLAEPVVISEGPATTQGGVGGAPIG